MPDMKVSTAIFAIAACIALQSCTTTPPSANKDSTAIPRYSIEQFMDTERLYGASFSPDGSHIAYSSNRNGVFNVYSQPVEGGEPQPLTQSETDAIFIEGFLPGKGHLLYSSDEGGNELSHIYLRRADGTVMDLTPGDDHRATFVDFSDDGKRFWIRTNERDPSAFDLYEYNADTLERELVVENTVGALPGPVSPNGRYATFIRMHVLSNTDILLFDRETGTIDTLVEDEGEVANVPETFSRDSTALYYRTDRNSEFQHLVRRDLETGEEHIVLEPDWDVTYAERSRGGNYLVAGINENSRTTLVLLSANDHSEVALPRMPTGNLTSVTFPADDSSMAFYVSDSRHPNNLYVIEPGGDARALTRSLNPAIASEHLVDGHVTRFESYDGLEIPGVLYKPHGATPDNPAPALVRVHGGPGGQARIGYNPLTQYLLNQGYAIFDINNRGSSGYGKTFFRLDTRCHGECDLGDVVAGKEMLGSLDWVDQDRVGIIGGSYGGYMVAAALAFEPEVFDVGVNIFGVTNWIRTLESMPPWWGPQREALFTDIGDPRVDEDRQRLHRISPLFHASNIVRPMIVLQGANDPRVLQVESDEIVEAVRANGVPVEYVLFPDEGHGFTRRENEIQGYQAISAFLEDHLR